MVGYLGTDYTFWAMAYDLPINFSTKDFSPDYAHSIVTSVDASSDGMSFTYHFRSGVKWSDGQPFTAADAAWTLNYYKANNVPNYSADLALMDKATATDDTTMVLTSTSPTSFYSGDSVFMYEYLLPEHIWGKFQDDYKGAKQQTGFPSVGTGPFIITNYVKNQFVQLDRNPNYWGNAVGLTPHVDQIIYRIYGNQDAEAAALQSGEVDFGYFSSANILNTLKSRGLETRGAAVPSFDEIGINTGSAYQTDPTGGFKPHGDGAAALQDVVLRQAMRRAVDNQTLVDKVLLGYGTPGISPVQPGATTGDWQPGPDDPDLSFNIAAANKMLDDAGYTMGPDGVRIDPKSGKPLDFRFFSRSSDQNSIDIVPYVSGWMQQIGIKLEPQTLNSNKLGNVILAGDYDLFEWGWYPNPDPNYILNIFTCAQRPPDANTYRNSDMLLLQPGLRQALRPARLGDERHGAGRHRSPDAGDPLPGPAVPRAVERLRPSRRTAPTGRASSRSPIRTATSWRRTARCRSSASALSAERLRVAAALRAASRPAYGSASSRRSSSSSAASLMIRRRRESDEDEA